MLFRRLQTRFIFAGSLLVVATVACGIWSAITFARLSSVVDDTLRDRQETIDRATAIVAAIAVIALLLSTFVSLHLARSVLRPIQEMKTALDALRQGDFARRVPATGAEELAQLGEGFNRMAENLAEYRRSSLGLDELRTELIAVVSHELKTPLTTLSLNLMMLSEWADNLTPRQREIVAAAVLGCEELSDTIDELLDLTRIEAGQLRLERSTIKVSTLIAQTVRSLQPRFDDAEITLQFVADEPDAVVPCDMARLRLVLTNLLTNSLKYTPRGGTVVIRLSSRQNAEVAAHPQVQIAVTDSGPGVPEAYRERIFEKFFRVEHDRHDPTRRVKGAGVGLYLCRQIVEAHGGAIRCESGDDGHGTRIAIQLPTEV